MNHEFNSPKNTKGFCFLMNAMRFREARCGFLETACQECLEKEFSKRSIPLVKSPGTGKRTMNHKFNNRERVLFSDECHAVQGS